MVAKHPQELVKANYDKARDQGIADEEIEEIIVVAAFGVYSDIGADALQIEVDTVTAEALTPLREMMTEQDAKPIQAAPYGLPSEIVLLIAKTVDLQRLLKQLINKVKNGVEQSIKRYVLERIVMLDDIRLSANDRIAGRPFTNPDLSQDDLATMRHMAHQLVDTYGDPDLCDFGPNKKPICQSDPKGRHFRIYYIQPKLLFSLKTLTVVGFFGQRRPDADIQPLIRADKKFEMEFDKHPGLLSLSTVRLANGDFGNLVLFTDPEAKDNWNFSQLHQELVPKISPPYYRSIRLNNAILPSGLEDPDDLHLLRVKYIDFDTNPPWRAVRTL